MAEERIAEVRRLEADIKKELGLLQLRLKRDLRQTSKAGAADERQTRVKYSPTVRDRLVLLVAVFVLLFAVSPLFRHLVIHQTAFPFAFTPRTAQAQAPAPV